MSGTGIRVSQMPAATTLAGVELLEVVQGGQSRQITVSQLLAIAAPLVHSHAITQVTGLQEALDSKAGIGGGAGAHTHAIADVTGLRGELDGLDGRLDSVEAATSALSSSVAGKASLVHSHAISDVTGLQTALNGKAATGQATTSGLTLNAQGLLGRRTAGEGAVEVFGIGAGLAIVGSDLTAPAGSIGAGANTWTGAQTYNGQELVAPTLTNARSKSVQKGSATTAQVFNVSQGGHQKLTVGAALAVSFTGWPATGLAELVIELVNGGAHILTWPTIRWVKSDGSFATLFSNSGVVLNTSGTDWIYIWTTDGGVTLWGAVLR
jgi:hypothetical protein